MSKQSVLKMFCAVAAAVLVGLGSGLPTLASADMSQWEETRLALRIQVDTRRNRVWVLSLNGVYVYDSRTRKLVKRVVLPDWTVVKEGFVCGPDLVLAASGAALVTSKIMPIIWEIDAESMAVREHNLALDADNDKDFGFTALSPGPGGRELLGVSSPLGIVWRIDLAAGNAQKVQFSKPMRGSFGV